jgi:hypothetical protein
MLKAAIPIITGYFEKLVPPGILVSKNAVLFGDRITAQLFDCKTGRNDVQCLTTSTRIMGGGRSQIIQILTCYALSWTCCGTGSNDAS